MGDEDSRVSGVEFGDLEDDLEDHDYPATTAEVVEAYGDRELDLPEGSATVREVLEPLVAGDAGDDADEGDTYESADEVQRAILTMVGDDAVGPEGYSDRGGQSSDGESESV